MTDYTRGATGSVRTGEDTEPAAATNSNRQARNGYSHDAEKDFRENGPGSESYRLGRTLPDPVVEEHKGRLRALRRAHRELEHEELAASWTPPPSGRSSLADDFAAERPPRVYAVDSLLGDGHNAALTAQFKTGKTTFLGNLTQAFADGTPFLGQFPVRQLAGRVGIWNYEMEEDDFIDYLRGLGIAHPERVATRHIKGYSYPLNSPLAVEDAVKWLTDNDIEVWIAEPWSGVISGSASENSNDEIAQVAQTIDIIKRESGVRNFITAVHTGRSEQAIGSEHARGATKLDDWVDARWVYTRDGAARYLRVEGRMVGLPETAVDFDPLTFKLTLGEGNRRERKQDGAVEEVVRIVTEKPGILTGKVKELMTTTTNESERAAAVRSAKEEGLIHDAPVGNSKPLHVGMQFGCPLCKSN